MTSDISLNSVPSPVAGGIRVISLRLLTPWTGVWLADLELDPDVLALAPVSGKVAITVGQPPRFTLQGTIDPRGSGTFVDFAHLRVLGGGAGWDKTVAPQHFHSDGGTGVLNTQVIAATAMLVGEVANVPVPSPLGPDFVRSAGPASRVLDGLAWWVDPAGVTQVGPRLPAAADPTLTLIRWDPTAQAAELTCDALVVPGTVLVDARLPGPMTVRDVEQRFDAKGSTVVAWCGVSATAQLMGDLRAMVAEFSGRQFLATYLYRIILQNADGRLQLQAVDSSAGLPDTLPLSPWSGLAGALAKYRLGSLVRVAFLEGDPAKPIVDSYQPGTIPLESTVDASVAVHVGPSAPVVALAGGTTPLVPAPWAAALASALEKFASALQAVASGPLSPLAAPASTLAAAVTALPPGATTKAVAA
jgi:hypothetical protein